MKNISKICVVVVGLLSITQNLFAQNWVVTGNTPGTGDFLGTTNTQPLELKTTNTGTPQPINFYTNNTPQMTVTGAGNVGIGTAAPTSLLHVVTSNALLAANHLASEIENNAQSVTGGLTNTGLRVTTDGGWIGTNIGLDVNVDNGSINYAALFNGGNVGIGTTTPASVLHLNRNAAVGVVTQYTNPNALSINGTGFQVGINGAGTGIIQHQAAGRFIDVSTFGHLPLASFTTDNFFGSPGPPLNTQGDGLRIYDPFVGTGNLDLWTSTSNQTHIVWGPNGRIQGINNRFEIQCDFTDGLWFNVTDPTTGTFFNAQGVENGRIGANTFWRIGANPGNVDAANTLEIDEGTAGFSGLRFTQLTSASTPSSANGLALSVNGSGDVILVPDGGGNVVACTSPTPAVNRVTKWTSTSPTTICNSSIIDDGNRVGIDNVLGAAKLFVPNLNSQMGILVGTTASNPYNNFGLFSVATNSAFGNRGIHSIGGSMALPTVPANANIGVVGQAGGTKYNFGGVFEANNCNAVENYGIWASARKGDVSGCYPALAGMFSGNIQTNVVYNFSDVKLKDSITNITDALSVIARVTPKQFSFKRDSFPYMNLPVGKHFGVIAQQIDTVLPTLIGNFVYPQMADSSGNVLADTVAYKSMNYVELIPLAIRGIQQLDSARMRGVTTNITAADSNRVVKWSSTDKMVTKGQMYDDGDRIGFPTLANRTFMQVSTANKAIAMGFSSTFDTATQVINATYSTNGNANQVAAVKGYSKYTNAASAPDGIGGEFEGGNTGVKGTGTGANAVSIGVTGIAQNATYLNAGVAGGASSSTSSANVGVVGDATNSTTGNVGVLGNAQFVSSVALNTGINGHAGKSTYQNMGADVGTVDTAGINYGIYSYVGGNAPKYYAGYFNGDVHATGTVTWVSDARFKNNAQNIEGRYALSALQKLQPKSYTFNKADYPYLTLPQGNQFGLLAQDLEQVLPNLVSDITHPETKDKDGNQLSPQLTYKAVNYAGIIPLLVSAVKQQQTKIDSLEEVISNKLTEIEERLNGCCGGSNKRDAGEENNTANINRVDVELSSMQVVVLQQNVPNPFAEQTSISYFIPEGIEKAQILFTDMLGATIKTVDVEPGYGIMTVFAQNLGTGQYSYSLLINGKVAETRKMMKGK